MKRKSLITLLLCLILLLIVAPMASAVSWMTSPPFYFLSADGSRVFHVAPDWLDSTPTGLYYNTDPLTLIYLVENPCEILLPVQFIFSRDLQYFAWTPSRNASRQAPAREARALVFYANGAVQRTYMVSDLVRDLGAVQQSMSAIWWHYRERNSLDLETNLLTIHTVDQRTLVFDITTGEIVESVEPMVSSGSTLLIRIVGIVVFVGGMAVIMIWRRRADRR